MTTPLTPTVAEATPSETSDQNQALALDGRHIRSFVRRQGKITLGQRKARETLAERWCLPLTEDAINPEELLGGRGPLILEIGFGMGETTAEIASRQPSTRFLGLEVYPAGVGSLLTKIEERGLTNLRILEQDAVVVIGKRLPAECLDGVHLFFPDPWPKARHHKRRLVQPPFIRLLTSRLKPGGYFHSATDWPDYADQMLAVLSAEPSLRNRAGSGPIPRPDWRPETKFEARGLRLGHPVADFVFEKV